MKPKILDTISLNGKKLSIFDVVEIADGRAEVLLDGAAMRRVTDNRRLVLEMLDGKTPVYGFNLGVGWNKDVKIDKEAHARFQADMIRSHCVSVGPEASEREVRAAMAARLNALLWGCTGSSPEIPALLASMLNAGIHPVIPVRGSLGEADIGCLSHIGLAMIGEGEVRRRGEKMDAARALSEAGLAPVVPGPKDGHAILSSNALSAGQGALVLHDLRELLETADIVYAVSLEAFNGNTTPLDPRTHAVRPFKGQARSAARIGVYLKDSYIHDPDPDKPVQDPLCFRDAAHVHGAVRDSLEYTEDLLTVQLNSSDDNPCLLPEGEIVSCANFEPLTWVLGFEMLGIALSHLSKASCLRSIKICSPQFSGLPRFLSPTPQTICFGTLQKTFVSLDNEIRHLCNPASIDGFCVAGEIEDRFTNAPYVVQKTRKILDNLRYILGIEIMQAAQALDYRKDKAIGKLSRACLEEVRRSIPFYDVDRPLTGDVEKAYELIKSNALLKIAAAMFSNGIEVKEGGRA